MADRVYRVLIAADRPGIFALAGQDWTVLENSIKEFRTLDSDDDLSLGEIGGVRVDTPGLVALAWK